MKTREEIRDWLLDNAVDEDGDLLLEYLDFSDLAGDVYLTGMKVKGDLCQDSQDVQGNLHQGSQKVQGNYYCSDIKVGGDMYVNDPEKILKEITAEELAEMGYKLEGEN